MFAPFPSAAASSDECRNAAVRAAGRHAIPAPVLVAMTEVESGSWPFTIGVNARGAPRSETARRYAGRGFRAADAETAARWVRGLRGIGYLSLDVGCLQVNLQWHADAFTTLEDAFDPDRNADYAARHLARLRVEHGSWERAVARYHASTHPWQITYLCKVRDRLAASGWTTEPDSRCSRRPAGGKSDPAAADRGAVSLGRSARALAARPAVIEGGSGGASPGGRPW